MRAAIERPPLSGCALEVARLRWLVVRPLCRPLCRRLARAIRYLLPSLGPRVSCLTACAISGPGMCFCVNMGEEEAALPPSVQLVGIDGRF